MFRRLAWTPRHRGLTPNASICSTAPTICNHTAHCALTAIDTNLFGVQLMAKSHLCMFDELASCSLRGHRGSGVYSFTCSVFFSSIVSPIIYTEQVESSISESSSYIHHYSSDLAELSRTQWPGYLEDLDVVEKSRKIDHLGSEIDVLVQINKANQTNLQDNSAITRRIWLNSQGQTVKGIQNSLIWLKGAERWIIWAKKKI